MDVSPKGDPPGFVRVLDPKTLAVPDRPGNHRGDAFLNVLENPHVGLMFVVPRRREVVRVSGTASVVEDPSLLESMASAARCPRSPWWCVCTKRCPLWQVDDPDATKP